MSGGVSPSTGRRTVLLVLAGLEDIVDPEDETEDIAIASGERDLLDSGDQVCDQRHGDLRPVATTTAPGFRDDEADTLRGQRLQEEGPHRVDAQLPVGAAVYAPVGPRLVGHKLPLGFPTCTAVSVRSSR